jgi:D-alanyl-D-alanine-carboxypeptidase/D-alanyl-D-alanine-endopeptidase
MPMRSFVSTLLSILLPLAVNAQSIQRLDGSTITADALTQKIRYLQDTAHVAGLCVIIFNKNRVVYKKAFGYKNLDTKAPLTTRMNFYGASLSKAVFAALVMKLVEEGQIDLDKPLQEYLDKPAYDYPPDPKNWAADYTSLKGDSLYRKITARMCLSHTSGFNNWRFYDPGEKLRMHFEPGARFSYSGEGFSYLQFVIEHKLGRSLDELAQEKMFGPAGMRMSAYLWKPQFEQDYSNGHTQDGKVKERDKDDPSRAGATMETTPDDYALFFSALMNNKILKAASLKEMFAPQIRITTATQFPPLNDTHSTANDAIGLSYGLGWCVFHAPYGRAAFKEGNGDGFQHFAIIYSDRQTAIIIMTNSENGKSIFKDVLETAVGDTYTPWKWGGYIPYNMSPS